MNDIGECQGYANRETWAVCLWIDNDEGTQAEAARMAAEARYNVSDDENVEKGVWTPEEAERFNLGDELKDWIEEGMPELEAATMASGLLGGALARVDWDKVARHYLDK